MTKGHGCSRQVGIASLALLGWCCGALVPSIGGAAEFKVGYVDVGTIFDEYKRTASSEAVLKEQGKAKEAEFETRMGELTKLRQGLELLNEEAKEARAQQIDEKVEGLQQFRTSATREFSRERERLVKKLLEEIREGLDAYAKQHDFSLILDSRSLLYGASGHDVTQEVLKWLNSR